LIGENRSLLAFKSWRIEFMLYPELKKIVLETVASGYARNTSASKQGDDFLIHQAFAEHFTCSKD
jgi:hypothetical protein